MSNIPDITSFSDLLSTPLEHSGEEGDDKKATLRASPEDEPITAPGERQIKDKQHDSVADLRDTESKETEVRSHSNRNEDLVEQQRLKLELIDRRNELTKNRTALKENNETLKSRINDLEIAVSRQMQDTKLARILARNNDNFLKRHYKNEDSSKEAEDADLIVNNLNVLPSSNWSERIEKMKFFYNYLDVENVSSRLYFDSGTNEYYRTLVFEATSSELFRVGMTLRIRSYDESIVSTCIQHSEKDKQVLNLFMLSPSYTRTLMRNYLARNKIDLVMFSLNSCASVIHQRISTFLVLMKMFPTFTNPRRYLGQSIDKFDEVDENIVRLLKTQDTLKFDVVSPKRSQFRFTVNLQWEVAVGDVITGKCVSDVRLLITRENIHSVKEMSTEPSYTMSSVGSLFLDLVKDYGVVHAVCIIFNNAFGIEST